MRRFEHGGDIYAHEGVVDFSSSLNPCGMPDSARVALREHEESFEAYPDPRCTELTQALAEYHDIDARQVICTAGATDLMFRVAYAAHAPAALVASPCYSGYEQALEQAGTRVIRHRLREEDDFALTDDFLQSMTEDASLVFLANPNNPTGLTIDPGLLGAVLERAAQVGARIVLDECFIDFTDAASMVAHVDEYPQLIVMRAFTKTYAMAGLRLGYGICSDAPFMHMLHEAGQPWAVSTPAQIAGLAALHETGYVQKSRAHVAHARKLLFRELECLGMRVIDGEANYLMFQCGRPLYEPLLERGVLIRRCENFDGVDGSWYRVAVRTTGENEQLIAALKEVLA